MTLSFRDQAGETRLVGSLRTTGGATGDVLTVQADGSVVPAAGGGSQPVATVTLTTADLLALDGTPVLLVPGQAGKLLVPAYVVFEYVAGDTPFTDNGGVLGVYWGDPIDAEFAGVVGAGFWDQATDQLYFAPSGSGPSSAVATPFDNVGLYAEMASPGAPTLGNGSVNVTIGYSVVTL